MMVTCMNDRHRTTPDPLFNPAYSNFCYEIPFMPGQTHTWTRGGADLGLRRRGLHNPTAPTRMPPRP